jgi:DNA polymerase I-like protein with 3'-5' exonuclease and polymerase domains
MSETVRLNVQAMSRRSESLMKSVVASPGFVFVSADLGAAEPSILSQYSKDPNYIKASFGMKGKAPYFDKEGTLIIDDIYLMVASRFPRWEVDILKAYYAKYDGLSFAEKWLEDPEYIAKKVLGKIRKVAKSMILGLSYGLGPKKLVLITKQAGMDINLKEAKAFFNLYWKMFPKVKMLGQKLEEMYDSVGYIQNDFGYALYPSAGYKCLNALIQSTVAGIMAYFVQLYFEENEWVRFVTQIHDEFIFEVPVDRIEEAKTEFYKAVAKLNKSLQWDIPLSFGWVEGKNLYESK